MAEYNVKSAPYNAKGDGQTDDTDAFKAVAAAVTAVKGGTIIIPPGLYIVGRQAASGTAEEILTITGCTDAVAIYGNGATLKAADGLRYGIFGQGTWWTPYNSMIDLENNANVLVQDLVLDGNNSTVVLGGATDAPVPGVPPSYQIPCSGIHVQDCDSVLILNVHTHHHCLDGVYISKSKNFTTCTPVNLMNVVSEYNGRQGLSWDGGVGVTATGCKFNHTGRGSISSGPGAGLDIEPEGAECHQGLFVGCDFIDNYGPGMVTSYANSIQVTNVRFVGCVFWGTTSSPIYGTGKRFRFEDCGIYCDIGNSGAGVPVVNVWGSRTAPDEATQFIRCTFEDRHHPLRPPIPPMTWVRTPLIELLDGNGAYANVLLEGCVLISNNIQSLYVEGLIIRNTDIVHRCVNVDKNKFQGLLRDCTLENVHFYEDFPSTGNAPWYIELQNVRVVSNVVVDGPNVLWGFPSLTKGLKGQISPGTY